MSITQVTKEAKSSVRMLQEVTLFLICFEFNYFLLNYLINVQRAAPLPPLFFAFTPGMVWVKCDSYN